MAARRGGVGVEPTEKLVQLVGTSFIPFSCNPTSPLEAGDFSHPTPYDPDVVVLQFVLQFSPVVVLALPDAALKLPLYSFEFCSVP